MRSFLAILLTAIFTTTCLAAEKDSLDIKIGQMIMIGVGDRTSVAPGDAFLQEIKAGKVGGVVLFEKNIASNDSRAKLKTLIQNLQQDAPIPLFVSIDEEGGRVHRLKEKYGFFNMPSAADLGRINNADTTLFYQRKLAALLADLGINLNYAPVLDMAMNPDNTVVVRSERTFGSDPELVAKHASLVIQAHHEYGVKTILKHFPGHGSSAGDSHYGIVDVTRTWKMIELDPYDRLIRSGNYDGIMTAHIVNERWDPSRLPATLSHLAITGLLRNLLGHNGVVFSDDMQMQAISDHYGWENAIVLAVNAGVDVLMFANTLPKNDKLVTATQIHNIIKNQVQNKKIPAKRIDEAYRRIMALKNKSFS